MTKVQGVADLGIFHLLGQPNLNIKIDREKAARYGLNTGDVNTVVQAALGGTTATTVLEGDRQFNLAVRLDPKYRTSVEAIRTVKVAYQPPSGTNGYVPLSELADITLDTGASFIYRERSQRFIPIKFSVRGRDLGGTVAEAQERVAKAIKLPNGYQILWAGEFDDLQNAKKRLMVVVPITLLLILVLLYGLFNSLRDSLLAVAGIPFAIGGGLIALYFAGLDFSVSAAIGFISLFGVAVMDGILNITYFRELRSQGMGIAEAVFHGAEQRMRPMLMTALSAGVGLFPAAISHGIGSQVQRPLATVVVGGMFIGPLLLLVVAPALRKIFLSRDKPIDAEDEDATADADKVTGRLSGVRWSALLSGIDLDRLVSRAGWSDRRHRAELRNCGDFASAVSGCAVGPTFSRSASAGRQRLRSRKARFARSRARRTSRGRSAFRHRRRRFGAVVVGIQIPAAQRTRQAIGRPQSKSAGRRGGDQGRSIQRAGPARIVLSAGHGQFERPRIF